MGTLTCCSGGVKGSGYRERRDVFCKQEVSIANTQVNKTNSCRISTVKWSNIQIQKLIKIGVHLQVGVVVLLYAISTRYIGMPISPRSPSATTYTAFQLRIDARVIYFTDPAPR